MQEVLDARGIWSSWRISEGKKENSVEVAVPELLKQDRAVVHSLKERGP